MDRSAHHEPLDDTSEDIDVRQILFLLFASKWKILAITLIGAGLGFAYLKVASPVYKATALVEIPQHQGNVAYIVDRQTQDLRSEDVINTIENNLKGLPVFLRIAQRSDFLELPAVEKSIGQPTDSLGPLELAEALRDWVKVGLVPGTRQIAVSAAHPSPELAEKLANAVVDEFVSDSEEKRIEELRIAGDFLSKEHIRITGERQKALQILNTIQDVMEMREKIDEQKGMLDVLKAQGKGDIHPETIGVKTLLGNYQTEFEASLAKLRPLLEGEGLASDSGPSSSENLDAEFRRLETTEAEISVRVDEYQANLEGILSRKTDNSMAMELPAPPVKIATKAYLPTKPSSPKKLQVLAASTVLGGGIGVLLILGLYFLDRSLKTVNEAEKVTGMPVVGAIPTDSRIPSVAWLEKKSKRQVDALIEQFSDESTAGQRSAPGKSPRGPIEPLILLSDPGSPAAEAFRTLRASLTLMNREQETKRRSLLVTSSIPGEGKSFVAANLAIAFASQEGQRTLLIDADLRCPMVDRIFNINAEGGGLKEGLDSGNVQVIASGIGNLDILPAGYGTHRPAELLSGPKMERLVRGLLENYDQVIFDSPPVNTVADALLLAPHIDGSLLVARSGRTPKDAVLHARDQLRKAGVTPLGLVLNCLPERSGNASNPYFYYYDGESQKYGTNYR